MKYENAKDILPAKLSEYFMSELVRIPLRLIETKDFLKMDGGEAASFEVPLLVFYEKGEFSVPYQAALFGKLKAEKKNAHYAFVFARNQEYGYFWKNYGKNFQR